MLIELRDPFASEDERRHLISEIRPTLVQALARNDFADSPVKERFRTAELLAALPTESSTQSPSAETKSDNYEVFSKVSSGQQQMKTSDDVASGYVLQLQADIYDAISTSTHLNDLSKPAEFSGFGLDSLQVTSWVDEINAFLRTTRPEIAPITAQDIDGNPSVEKLMALFYNLSGVSADSDLSTSQ